MANLHTKSTIEVDDLENCVDGVTSVDDVDGATVDGGDNAP
jgi:hypothetical protein